jgi:hypothetical protein
MWSYSPDRTDKFIDSSLFITTQKTTQQISRSNSEPRQNWGGFTLCWKQCMLLTREHAHMCCLEITGSTSLSSVAIDERVPGWTSKAQLLGSIPVFVLATILSRFSYLHIHINIIIPSDEDVPPTDAGAIHPGVPSDPVAITDQHVPYQLVHLSAQNQNRTHQIYAKKDSHTTPAYIGSHT